MIAKVANFFATPCWRANTLLIIKYYILRETIKVVTLRGNRLLGIRCAHLRINLSHLREQPRKYTALLVILALFTLAIND